MISMLRCIIECHKFAGILFLFELVVVVILVNTLLVIAIRPYTTVIFSRKNSLSNSQVKKRIQCKSSVGISSEQV